MFLVQPTAKHLASYIAALERGYAPSTTREESRFEDLRKIEVSPETFLSDLYDPEAKAWSRAATRWLARATHSQLHSMDVGRGVCRKYQLALVARNWRFATNLYGAYWLQRGVMETRSRLCEVGVGNQSCRKPWDLASRTWILLRILIILRLSE